MTAIVRDVNRSPAGRDAGGFGWAVGEIWDTGCAVSPVPDGAMGSGPIGADAGRFEGGAGGDMGHRNVRYLRRGASALNCKYAS